jgi:protein-S-isoprenylcysteine O-methyltransferase Ste14
MSTSMPSGERRWHWLMRVVPMALLAVLYGSIAVRWFAVMSQEVGAAFDGVRVVEHLLLSIYAVFTAVFYAIVALVMFVRKEPIRRERRALGYVLPFAAVFLMGMVGGGELRDPSLARAAIATLLVVCGMAFTLYALRHLGRHFGVVSDVRGLVTTGPYRFARHPLYAGETLTSFGILLAVATPLLVASFVAGLLVQIWRARIEEQALTSVFPNYREYARRTPMLIPIGVVTHRGAQTLTAPSGD